MRSLLHWARQAFLSGTIITGAVHAQDSTAHRKEVIDALRGSLPKFDAPSAAAPALVPEKVTAAPKPTTVSTPVPSPAKDAGEAVLLPRMVITPGLSPEALAPFPRLRVESPQKEVSLDPLMSADERKQKLVEKHLSSLDRNVLNRFNHAVNYERARDAELRAQTASLLNQTATILEASQLSGTETEEDRKLREEYMKMLYSRPR